MYVPCRRENIVRKDWSVWGVHAQPKKSAAPIFCRMLASHERALAAARTRGEPAGQIAAREMEVARLRQALRRVEELTMDVAAAIEEMAEGAVSE